MPMFGRCGRSRTFDLLPPNLATYNPFAGSGVGYALNLARPSTSCSSSVSRCEEAVHIERTASACRSRSSTSASTLEQKVQSVALTAAISSWWTPSSLQRPSIRSETACESALVSFCKAASSDACRASDGHSGATIGRGVKTP
jgi:hypothetical protein